MLRLRITYSFRVMCAASRYTKQNAAGTLLNCRQCQNVGVKCKCVDSVLGAYAGVMSLKVV